MSFDVTVILPNNLRSGYLQSEFIAGGLAYTTNKFSFDPDIDRNRNQINIGFELRDKTTREIVSLKRIHSLLISNDPFFEPKSTISISNWPPDPEAFSTTVDYTYNINTSYFFDNTNSQGSIGSTSSGTGIFKINNWALSANGGLSRVFVKAILEGPSKQLVEYPNGYGIFDTISWEGELPVNPDNLEFTTLKNGWIGKNTLATITPSSSVSQINNNGIASYLVSTYEVSATGNTLDVYPATGSSTYRTISPSASVASTTCLTYDFYREGGVSYYSSASMSFDSVISRGNSASSVYSGAMFYTRSKLLSSSSKPDIQFQGNLSYSEASIGLTSCVFLKLYDQPDYSANSKEIVMRIDIPKSGNPTSYLYTVTNNVESGNIQTTTLPNSLNQLLENGGNYEFYYSKIDDTYAYVESYFTPNEDQNSDSRKSYMLGNCLISSLGSTYIGGALGFQNLSHPTISDGSNPTFRELTISQGSNMLSADLGDLNENESSGIYQPIVQITNSWTTDENVEYINLQELPQGLIINTSVTANYVQVNKIDSSDSYIVPGICELQLYKPSLSKNLNFEVKVLHKTDDFYVAFSNKSSYRVHTENGMQVEWDRAIGSRILFDYSYSSNPVNASTVVVLFSKSKNNISILQRNDDGTYNKTVLKTYKPSASFDRYIIEITDQVPNHIKGNSNLLSSNATYIYVKTSTGSSVDLIGYAQLNQKVSLSNDGLGYYAASGFVKSNFDDSSGSNYNKIYEMKLKASPDIKYKNLNSKNVKSITLSNEALSESKHYLGQKLLSGNTDLSSFSLVNEAYGTTYILNTYVASAGQNVDLDNIASATIDGVVLSSMNENQYILLKDQLNISENGVYQKTGSSTYTNVTSSIPSYARFKITAGTLNKYSFFYKNKVVKNTEVFENYITTSVFCPITIDEISPFVSSIRPRLFEFKLKHLNPNDDIDQSLVKVRFFQNSNNSPDGSNPLTDWIEINTNPINNNFIVAPNNSLVQVIMENAADFSPLVSQGDKIWALITCPDNTAFGVAEGKVDTEPIVLDGSFTYYQKSQNLWHKLYARYTTKSYNSNHLFEKHIRVRAKSHGKLESNATNLVGPVKVDIYGPNDVSGAPKIDNLNNSNLRNVELTITAEDNDSGIMAFRFGKEIDNFRTQYTPWLPWSQFVNNDNGVYTVNLYGSLNYYTSGTANTGLNIQNIGFSGPRKIWVQLMDYASNITQSYPVTFVAQAWSLVDTNPPVAEVNFYNPKTNSSTTLTNLTKPIIKIDANDIVSGVKDFKYRRIFDTGADDWSEWQAYSPYKVLDFSNENDGVKKVEFIFRDYGNNSIQQEEKWEVVMRPNK